MSNEASLYLKHFWKSACCQVFCLQVLPAVLRAPRWLQSWSTESSWVGSPDVAPLINGDTQESPLLILGVLPWKNEEAKSKRQSTVTEWGRAVPGMWCGSLPSPLWVPPPLWVPSSVSATLPVCHPLCLPSPLVCATLSVCHAWCWGQWEPQFSSAELSSGCSPPKRSLYSLSEATMARPSGEAGTEFLWGKLLEMGAVLVFHPLHSVGTDGQAPSSHPELNVSGDMGSTQPYLKSLLNYYFCLTQKQFILVLGGLARACQEVEGKLSFSGTGL